MKRVADWQEIWSLANVEGWVLYGDKSGQELVPVWPHPRFAEACAQGEWSDCEPRLIELDEWLDQWTPGMIEDKRLVVVFPTPDMRSTVVTPERLEADLRAELSLIED